MNQSLSVILPVYNVENELSRRVNEMLDVVSDLTGELEIMIVDDGSSDNTEEVSMELARQYPQVSAIRTSERTGEMTAARTGIAKTNGAVVMIHDVQTPLSGDAMRQLWAMRNDRELVFARSEPAHRYRIPHIAKTGWTGTQMLRREAVHELQEMKTQRPTIDRVMRTDVGKEVTNPASILRQLTESYVDPGATQEI